MHQYDVALKRILSRPGSAFLKALTGCTELRWLNVELPKVTNLRVDALAELPRRGRIHFEFQVRNERKFAFRMAEYGFGIARQYGDFPRQCAIYVGRAPLRMKNTIELPNLTYRFDLIDIRDIDGEPLLASANLSDNVIAVLTRAGGEPGALRRILERIADSPVGDRGEALTELNILTGLRGLSGELKREAKKMPITVDLMKNEIIGPALRQGLARGRVEGRVEGLAEGRVEGQIELLTSLIEIRFGTLAPPLRNRLNSLKPDQIRVLGLRLLDAESVEDLFGV